MVEKNTNYNCMHTRQDSQSQLIFRERKEKT